jgi:hypothetical protein
MLADRAAEVREGGQVVPSGKWGQNEPARTPRV